MTEAQLTNLIYMTPGIVAGGVIACIYRPKGTMLVLFFIVLGPLLLLAVDVLNAAIEHGVLYHYTVLEGRKPWHDPPLFEFMFKTPPSVLLGNLVAMFVVYGMIRWLISKAASTISRMWRRRTQ